jgi:exoribonuclease R
MSEPGGTLDARLREEADGYRGYRVSDGAEVVHPLAALLREAADALHEQRVREAALKLRATETILALDERVGELTRERDALRRMLTPDTPEPERGT